MSPEVLITFIAACILLALTPGPNMSLILANTLTSGLRAGFVTLAGTTTGLALLVAAAAAGMSSMMVFMSEWFDVIRWIGALYLVYLGARQLWLLRRRASGRCAAAGAAAGANLYLQGVLVSLSNPKVLLFLGAFLPQFVDPARDPVCAALRAGRAVRRRAGRRRRRLYAGGRPGADHLRCRAPAPPRRRRRRPPAARRPGPGDGAPAVIGARCQTLAGLTPWRQARRYGVRPRGLTPRAT